MNQRKYKGYIGKATYDAEANFYHGEVNNTRDVITFQGQNASDLARAFRESVDDYLAFCHERGESPDRPVQGEGSPGSTPFK